jgi:8-oxo-dGTP pyrophosphatase MutT (NUDIX family)
MAQKYRIYINEKVILITSSLPKNFQNYENIKADILDLKLIYPWVLANYSKQFYIVKNDPKKVLKQLLKSIPIIKAAGGLVMNENKEYLFIYRNDKWDLPKGKIEKKEGIKEAAVREVEEECGIKVSKLEDKICNTYHIYTFKGEPVIKKTFWFNMTCKGAPKLIPQKEEGITEAKWFKKSAIANIVSNTYPSIMDVLKKEGFFKEKVKLPSV